MTFLNPAILFGLLAATLPIIFHFLNLRKVKRVEFSSIKFLKELQQTKIKRLKFKQLLLLALRVLIIASIVLAFARPTVESNLPIYSGTKRAQYFILDNSFSMSRLGESGSYFNHAKSVILEMVKNSNEVSGNYILTTTADSAISLSSDNNSIERIVNNLELSNKKGDVSSATNRAIRLSETNASAVNEFYLLSDLQKSNLSRDSINDRLTRGITNSVYIYKFDTEAINNRSISNLTVDRQILGLGKNISVSALVTNHSETAVTNQAASLYVNGKRKSIQSFNLQSGESTSLLFSFTLEESGFVKVNVELEEDDILADNTDYLSIFVPEKLYITIYSGSQSNYSFVKTVFDESENIIATVANPANLGFAKSEKTIPIIFLENSYIAEQAAQLILSGRSAIVFPDESITTDAFSAFCNMLNIDPGELRTNSLSEFRDVAFEHPIFQSLFDKEKKELSSPSIFSHYSRKTNAFENPITTLSDGSVFLSELRMSNNKSLLFNSAPTLNWSNLPLKSIFAPMLTRSASYLSDTNNESKSLTVGDEINIETKEVTKELRIITPDKLEESIALDSLLNKNSYSYKKVNKSGYYQIFKNGSTSSILAVNTDPLESNAGYLEESEAETLFNERNIQAFSFADLEELSQLKEENLLGTELMKHFLILALIFALLEMVISRNSKKDLIEQRAK